MQHTVQQKAAKPG